jgi:hypothetical protein
VFGGVTSNNKESLQIKQPLRVRTFLKVYMELGSSFLFLQEQIKDIIIIITSPGPTETPHTPTEPTASATTQPKPRSSSHYGTELGCGHSCNRQIFERGMMIVLLLFLQKQSLAFAVYLFGIGTLHTGPGLKKKHM